MKRILELQTRLKCPKGRTNSFGHYKYRSLSDIFESVKPIASELGLVVTVSDDVVLIGDRYYVKAVAEIKNAETGKTLTSVTAFAREADVKKGMDSSQITGAASSYARKYALSGLLLLDDVQDVDTDSRPQPTDSRPKPTEKPFNFEKFRTIVNKVVKERGIPHEAYKFVLHSFGLKTLADVKTRDLGLKVFTAFKTMDVKKFQKPTKPSEGGAE